MESQVWEELQLVQAPDVKNKTGPCPSAATQREAQKAADAQRVLASVQSEVQRLEGELEAVRRERDNLKMEMSLVKARSEAQKVKLESELKVALEQRVTERLAEVHEDSLRQMSAMREQHRKQLLELSSHHDKELGGQLAQFKSDLAEREERQRHLTEDYERRISKQHEELRELQARYRRLEAQRAEMVSQFQAMMQAHWNEALHLFAGSSVSPQLSAKAQEQDAPSDPDPTSDPESLQPSESLKKTQKVESRGSSQGTGDCEGPAWTQAAAPRPLAQHNSKPAQDPYRHFLPLLPDMGRASSEFSRVLNYSLLGQPGFQKLEPQADTTVAGSGLTFHLENLAEHPFTDETDEATTEGLANEGETLQQHSLESEVQLPQTDLHYYMRLLWERSAYESCAQKQEEVSTDSPPYAMNQTQLGTSYHEHSTALWDPVQPPINTIRIQPPSNSAVHKTKVPLPRAGPAYVNPEATSPPGQNPAHEGGILSPKQVAEVSRLLKQYQAKGRSVPSTEELYKYLRGIGQNGIETKGDGNPQACRNLDSRLTEATRKEVASTRRTGTLGFGREKPHVPAKAGKKPTGVPAPNPRTSRGGGVWR